ncbi:MAG: hypothetical protein ACYCTE_05700 [Acidimicrobiales bacterium]
MTNVGIEATGQYWKPIWYVLEEQGFELMLVNARHVKILPGRKTDLVTRRGALSCSSTARGVTSGPPSSAPTTRTSAAAPLSPRLPGPRTSVSAARAASSSVSRSPTSEPPTNTP